MSTMFIKTPESGYHFTTGEIAILAKHYGAQYLGYWTIKRESGWSDQPVDVFYQPNPDVSKGHSHYFGMFRLEDKVLITNAESAFNEPITGLLTENGEVIVSRYRHNCVVKGSYMIDGGRDYLRTSGNSADGKLVKVTVENGGFQFEVY